MRRSLRDEGVVRNFQIRRGTYRGRLGLRLSSTQQVPDRKGETAAR